MKKKIVDTLNGALNKQLIDNFVVSRRIDGSELSENEIMQLTRPYFKSIIHMEEQPEVGGLRYDETPIQKQFGATIQIAAAPSDEAEAARLFVRTIVPMCHARSESQDGSMDLYNSEQMVVSFIAGQQWLRDRIAQRIPLGAITAEGALGILKDFLYAIPKGWSIEQAIEHLKSFDE